MADEGAAFQQDTAIAAGGVELPARLEVPSGAAGLVVYLPGSRPELFGGHGRYLTDRFVTAGYGVLRADLLTEKEDHSFAARCDTELLAARLLAVIRWLSEDRRTRGLDMALYAAYTGAGAALRALAALAAEEGEYLVNCVVCRSGRPDPAPVHLDAVNVPTLLLVADGDADGLRLNRGVLSRLDGESTLEVVPDAGADFDGAHAVERLASLSLSWYERYL